MALHPDFPDSPHVVLEPTVRWFPAILLWKVITATVGRIKLDV